MKSLANKTIVKLAFVGYAVIWVMYLIPDVNMWVEKSNILIVFNSAFTLFLISQIIDFSEQLNSDKKSIQALEKTLSSQNAILKSISNIIRIKLNGYSYKNESIANDVLNSISNSYEKEVQAVLQDGRLPIVGYEKATDLAKKIAKWAKNDLTIKSMIQPGAWKNGNMNLSLSKYLQELEAALSGKEFKRVVIYKESQISEWSQAEWEAAEWFSEKITEIGGNLLFASDRYDNQARWLSQAIVVADLESPKELQHTTQPEDIISQYGYLVFDRDTIDSGVEHLKYLISNSMDVVSLKNHFANKALQRTSR